MAKFEWNTKIITKKSRKNEATPWRYHFYAYPMGTGSECIAYVQFLDNPAFDCCFWDSAFDLDAVIVRCIDDFLKYRDFPINLLQALANLRISLTNE